MDLFTYLMAKKGHNTHRDLFSYLLGKNAGGSGTYTTFSGTSLNISNTLQAKIKNIALEGNTSQDGDPTPDTPIPIKVVTGEQNVEISGKNKFNLYEHTNTLASNTTIINSNSYKCEATGTWQGEILLSFDNLKANTTYTFSADTSEASRFIVTYVRGIKNGEYTTLISNIYADFLPIRFNTSDYELINIRMYARGNGASSGTQIVKNIQLEEGTQVTEFVPYQLQTYPLSLGNIELAKIGNYKDYIFKNVVGSPYYNAELDLNGWYKYKTMNKYTFTGNESISVTGDVFYTNDIADNILTGGIICICNRMKAVENTSTGSNLLINTCCFRPGNYSRFYFNMSSITTVASEIKQYLSENNTYVIYPLGTPTYEKITNSTLIQQLENLNNARSYKGTTIIECTSASTDNETIVFSGDIKVTSVGLGNSLNTSLLSSNIQEQPNLDDVNEIEETEEEVS